jgi:hypothetical protein
MISRQPLRRALSIAGLYLLTSVVLNTLRQHHAVSDEMAVRLMGMLTGLVVVVVGGNAIPKTLVPLARLSCAPAREPTLRRVCGWAAVVGGLGYTLAYALAPMTFAAQLANGILAPAFVVVGGIMARCAWIRSASRSGV